MAEYTYSVASDTLNEAVDIEKLTEEIRDSEIKIALSHINVIGDTISVFMKDELDVGDESLLGFTLNGHDGVPIEEVNSLEKVTKDNVLRVSVESTEGSRYTAITPNWTDKTTWYFKSIKVSGQTLVDSGDHTNYDSPTGKCWIDNYHGKYSDEDFITTEEGYVPRLKVYVDDVEKTEQDPHDGYGGDFIVDYRNSRVTFLTPLSESETITVDTYEVNGSDWILRPQSGKKLKIVSTEVQFSSNISIKDSVTFQPYGLVDVFAPQYTPTPYPSGTKIPLGNPTIYKSQIDYINEANGSKPPIPATTCQTPTWRDLDVDVITYPWNYQAVTEIFGNYGMEILVKLQHDVELGGSLATATFYCLSYDDS